jgi:hypothetical protein
LKAIKKKSKMDNHKSSSSRTQLLLFFGFTFLFTWSIWITLAILRVDSTIYKVGTFAPTIVALLLTWFQSGGSGVKKLLKKLLIWRVHIGWYLFSFFVTVPIVLLAIWIHVWLGGAKPQFNDPSQLYLVIPAFLYVLFFSVLGEEIGWRGYALPRLLKNVNGLTAGLSLGLVWGLWHLPLFWMAGNFHSQIPLIAFLLQVTAASVVYTWMYVNTDGSLLLPHLFHAASNTTLGLLPILPMDTGGAVRPMWIAVVLWCLVAFGIVIVAGRDLEHHHQEDTQRKSQ